jgi:dTDP-4-dehydrorhamnose reductase
MNIFVLGNTGMLGRYVSTFFKTTNFKTTNYKVVEISRDSLDATAINASKMCDLFLRFGIRSEDTVINCMGIIKHKVETDIVDFINVNAIFPNVLANVCEYLGAYLIHPSSDCVYSGLKGNYSEDDEHDALDIYGKTKSLGEPKNATVIRTSIIGEELKNFTSLLEWVKSNKNKTINGYINHFWNGISCLEFALICYKIIIEDKFWIGVRNIYTINSISKFELIKLISDVYNLNINVIPIKTNLLCDRTLDTIYNDTDFILNYIDDYRKKLEDLIIFRPTLNK